MDLDAIDPRRLRDALGRFATGVTVITTTDADGNRYGVTANSYNSVSLDPPLILWSLAKSSRSMPAFAQCDHFAVHILGEHQEALAMRFASSADDKFAGLETREGIGGVPLFDNCAAHLECSTENAIEGGDHTIFLGRVLNFESCDCEPLLFHAGRFARVGR
jgi:flavin reductase (DIM6/NTAB) family NADH-FMN oxidoreductase RutF